MLSYFWWVIDDPSLMKRSNPGACARIWIASSRSLLATTAQARGVELGAVFAHPPALRRACHPICPGRPRPEQGKTMACLITDLRNPMSNRCYAKIGFQPVCNATFFPRRAQA
jgi:hypothetical protein